MESTATNLLSEVITSGMVSGVLDQIIAVLPILLPAAISFIGVRKGIAFVLGMLRSA